MFKITEPNIIYNKIINIEKNINNRELFLELHNNKDKDVFESLTIRKMSGIRNGWYRSDRKSNHKYFSSLQLLFLEFLKCDYVYISNNDWFDIFDIYKNYDKTIFIFDPPYIERDNTLYKNPTLNVYDYFKNNNINNFQSNIFFMLEDIPVIRELFIHNKIYEPYDKRYAIHFQNKTKAKSNTKHIIISNKF
jgi:hypothetical protein